MHDWNVVIKNFVPSYDKAQHPEFAKLAFRSSPMASVDTWRSPVLFIQGDDDRNVPFTETITMAHALAARGVYYAMLPRRAWASAHRVRPPLPSNSNSNSNSTSASAYGVAGNGS
ncbi:MAG: prolyl oligopeptidase family serine peptidase [Gemmatimonadota bacterium]